MLLTSILSKATKDHPNISALLDPAQDSLSYAVLSERVGQMSKVILSLFPSAPPLLALCASKSTQSLTALLAILQSGAAYVPLDAHGAPQRNALILQDCRPAGILLSEDWIPILQKILPCPTRLHSLPATELSLLICKWENPIELADDLAFILYTSGSTGTPKGVQITQQNALAFVQWAAETFDIPAGSVCTSIAPFHFDLSVFDIFVSLSKGATVLLINQKSAKNPRLVAQWLGQYQVHTCYATPSFLKLLFRHGRLPKFDHSSLQQVLFAGEVFDISSLKEIKGIWPQAVFYNLYGPTETNVVTYFQVPANIVETQIQPFPIGKSCSGSKVKCWKDGQLIDFQSSIEGELAVTGPSVTPGYLGLPEKNASSFVQDELGNYYYLTGDWVEMDSEGNLVFKGRKDRMVKRRGYRLELGEIEQALAAHPVISEAACIWQEETSQLIVFYSLHPDNTFPKVLELNQFLLSYLPSYMLPDNYTKLEDLPQTSTQKIDYQKLKNDVSTQ